MLCRTLSGVSATVWFTHVQGNWRENLSIIIYFAWAEITSQVLGTFLKFLKTSLKYSSASLKGYFRAIQHSLLSVYRNILINLMARIAREFPLKQSRYYSQADCPSSKFSCSVGCTLEFWNQEHPKLSHLSWTNIFLTLQDSKF